MSPVQPTGAPQPGTTDEEAIRTGLDALASGSCTASAFLHAMRDRFSSDPEANWEVLSQLDQYYRRGRIPSEMFKTLKTQFAESALGVVNRRDTAGAIDTPSTVAPNDIPVAREVVVPTRAEHTDIHDTVGEPKTGGVLRRRYRLEALLGQGSTGPVFQAVDEYRLDSPGSQRLAIKILHPAVIKRAELLAELRRAFQSLQLLSHPNILRVFEFDRDGPLVFFTMELLTGSTLSRVLQVRELVPLDQFQAFALIREIGAALAYAHSRGIVHGNLNPRNVFITEQGELRLLGFAGSSKSEQTMQLPADDVYGLACIAYLLLCAEHPFGGKTAIEARDAGRTLRRPIQVDDRQWVALRAGLSWDGQRRPHNVQQWLDQFDLSRAAPRVAPLGDLLEAPPREQPKSRWPWLTAVGVGLLLAVTLFWFVNRPGVQPEHDSAPPTSLPSTVSASQTPTSAAIAPAASTSAAVTPTAVAPAASTAPIAAPPVAVSTAPAAAAVTPAVASAGTSKIELATDTVDVPPGELSAQVTVRRKGSLRGETSFTWWTESGTAKPSTDFSAVVPQLAHIGDGKSNVTLSIPLSGAARAQPKSFYVVIDQSEGGATLGARTLAMITLLPST